MDLLQPTSFAEVDQNANGIRLNAIEVQYQRIDHQHEIISDCEISIAQETLHRNRSLIDNASNRRIGDSGFRDSHTKIKILSLDGGGQIKTILTRSILFFLLRRCSWIHANQSPYGIDYSKTSS